MKLVFIGPPGAGKGTQAKIVSMKYNIQHISTGDKLRENIKNGTLIGKKAESYTSKGELVPDEIILDMIKDILNDNSCKTNGFLLDGFPRNLNQKEELDKLLKKMNMPIDKVIVIDVPEKELVERLLLRAEKEGRKDDTKEVIENRLRIYNESTKPIIDSYKKDNLVHFINGLGSVEEISKKIFDEIS